MTFLYPNKKLFSFKFFSKFYFLLLELYIITWNKSFGMSKKSGWGDSWMRGNIMSERASTIARWRVLEKKNKIKLQTKIYQVIVFVFNVIPIIAFFE